MATAINYKNAMAANLNFEEKKKIYKTSSFLLTNQLSEADNWNISAIEQWQKILADLAVKTWQI